MSRPPYLLLGSAPLAPIAIRELEKAGYPPIAVIDNPRLDSDGIIELINEHNPRFLLIASYGAILKPAVIERMGGKLLNVHPSLLPLYRGPSPVVQALLDGVTETGVTLIELDAKMDHGPILAQEKLALSGDETSATLYELLTARGVALFLSVIDSYLAGTAAMVAQDHEKATYCHFIKKEQGLLDLSEEPAINERKIRAFHGWPGTWIMHRGRKLFIRDAHLEDGRLLFDRVQPESRKEISLAEYCAGLRVKPEDFYKEL